MENKFEPIINFNKSLVDKFEYKIDSFLDKIKIIPIFYHIHKCAGTYFSSKINQNLDYTMRRIDEGSNLNEFKHTYKKNKLVVLDENSNLLFKIYFSAGDDSYLDKLKLFVRYNETDKGKGFDNVLEDNANLLHDINKNKKTKVEFLKNTFNLKSKNKLIGDARYDYQYTISFQDFLNFNFIEKNVKILFIEICSSGFIYRNDLNKFLESQNLKFKNFMVVRDVFERHRSLYNYLKSDASIHEKTHLGIISKTFDEYVKSEEFEEDWIFRNFNNIGDGVEFKLTKKIFDSFLDEISDFELATLDNIEILINKILINYYFIKDVAPVNWENMLKHNKNKEKVKTLNYNDLSEETKKIFKTRTEWDTLLFNFIKYNNLNTETIYFGNSYAKEYIKKYADCVKNKNDDYSKFNDEYIFNSLCKLQSINGKILITKESDDINSYTLHEENVLVICLNENDIRNNLQVPVESIKTFWKIKLHLVTSNLLSMISMNKGKFDKIYLVNPPNHFMDYADLLPSHFEILENGKELLLDNTKLTICSPILSEMNLNGLQKIREVRCKNNNKNNLHERLIILKPHSECKYLEETFSKLHQNLQAYCKEKNIDLVVSHNESGKLVDKFMHFLGTSKYIVVFTEFENPQFLFNCINKNSKVLEIAQTTTYSQTIFESYEKNNNLFIVENLNHNSMEAKYISKEKKTFLMTINNLYNGWFNSNLKYRLLCLKNGVDVSKFNSKILSFFKK